MRIITKNTTTPGKIPEPSDLLVGELAVNTADGRIYTKHIDDSIVACGVDPYPEAPTILSPTGTGITLIPTLVTSAYVIAAADAHLYSRYQISTNSTFTNIVYDSGIIGTNLTTITINVKLEQNTDYYIRARHCASNGGWSFWGAAKHIVTTNVVIAQPTLTIQDAPNNIPLVPVLTGTPFESTGDADQFWAADQKVMYDTTTLYSGTDNITDGTTFKVPWGVIDILTEYTFMVRYQGTSRVYSPQASATGTTVEKSMYVAVTGGATNKLIVYYQDYDTLHRLPDNHIIDVNAILGSTNCATFTPDGKYLVLGANHATSPLTFQKREKDIFTYLSDITPIPGSTAQPNEVDITPDGLYLSTTWSVTPYMAQYKRDTVDSETWTKLTNPTTVPTSGVQYQRQSPDGTYLASGHTSTPWAQIYKRSGDTLTRITPGANPVSQIYGMAQSDDGTQLVYTQLNSPYITIYKRSGDVFTKQSNPAALPGASYACTFTRAGDMFIMGVVGAGVVVYTISGDTQTKMNNPPFTAGELPTTGSISSMFFDKTGTYLYVKSTDTSLPFIIYRRSESNVFTKLANPESLPPTSSSRIGVQPRLSTP